MAVDVNCKRLNEQEKMIFNEQENISFCPGSIKFFMPLYKSVINNGWQNGTKRYMKLGQDPCLTSFRSENICSYIFVMNKETQFTIKA